MQLFKSTKQHHPYKLEEALPHSIHCKENSNPPIFSPAHLLAMSLLVNRGTWSYLWYQHEAETVTVSYYQTLLSKTRWLHPPSLWGMVPDLLQLLETCLRKSEQMNQIHIRNLSNHLEMVAGLCVKVFLVYDKFSSINVWRIIFPATL